MVLSTMLSSLDFIGMERGVIKVVGDKTRFSRDRCSSVFSENMAAELGCKGTRFLSSVKEAFI